MLNDSLDFGCSVSPARHPSLSAWHRVHHVNLDGVFLGCKFGIALMKTHGGSIINVFSCSGMVGILGASAYASSKAAVRNHSKTVALYCAEQRYNIRCNSVHPRAILTSMWDPMLGEDEASRKQSITAVAAGVVSPRFVHNPLQLVAAIVCLNSGINPVCINVIIAG